MKYRNIVMALKERGYINVINNHQSNESLLLLVDSGIGTLNLQGNQGFNTGFHVRQRTNSARMEQINIGPNLFTTLVPGNDYNLIPWNANVIHKAFNEVTTADGVLTRGLGNLQVVRLKKNAVFSSTTVLATGSISYPAIFSGTPMITVSAYVPGNLTNVARAELVGPFIASRSNSAVNVVLHKDSAGVFDAADVVEIHIIINGYRNVA